MKISDEVPDSTGVWGLGMSSDPDTTGVWSGMSSDQECGLTFTTATKSSLKLKSPKMYVGSGFLSVDDTHCSVCSSALLLNPQYIEGDCVCVCVCADIHSSPLKFPPCLSLFPSLAPSLPTLYPPPSTLSPLLLFFMITHPPFFPSFLPQPLSPSFPPPSHSYLLECDQIVFIVKQMDVHKVDNMATERRSLESRSRETPRLT